ncbi:DedA family protein, partial [Acinetobacter baumannii]|nr:DedA family protein [Acinetobacter baumannii]MCL8320276.1 DedA family protein [Acinetobacter baumannii]MDC4012191.1 DedA family protein [Acinetobacter baumannii]MDC4106462.1 DedA family protein [Acinetobacter baumannii]MDC4109512.1 DedA family protein [Acinetobacter baumannii]
LFMVLTAKAGRYIFIYWVITGFI